MRVAWRKRLRLWPARVIAAAAVSLVLASCTQTAPPVGHGTAPPRSGEVISLNQISTLKSLFNRDDGHPRLVLVFSPT